MPSIDRVKRVTPALWRIKIRPLAEERGSGPGVGDHARPVSSSRTNNASPPRSTTGSLANGVNRFSRLLTDHVVAEPLLLRIVPKRSLAITLTHGAIVSSSPSRTIA